jgi:hypothetical protein
MSACAVGGVVEHFVGTTTHGEMPFVPVKSSCAAIPTTTVTVVRQLHRRGFANNWPSRAVDVGSQT